MRSSPDQTKTSVLSRLRPNRRNETVKSRCQGSQRAENRLFILWLPISSGRRRERKVEEAARRRLAKRQRGKSSHNIQTKSRNPQGKDERRQTNRRDEVSSSALQLQHSGPSAPLPKFYFRCCATCAAHVTPKLGKKMRQLESTS